MKIELKDLHHIYPNGDHALRNVNLTIGGIETVAIIGQNGAGKTTLVRHFNGILRPTEGRVLLDGEDIVSKTTAQLSHKIGYVFQNPDDQLFLESVRKELEFGAKMIDMSRSEINDRMEYIANLTGLQDKLDVHPFDLTASEKKFCTMGAVIMMDPQVLVFDEPTCGLDLGGINRLKEIINSLRREGKLCIAISHDMQFVVNTCERIVVMQRGEVMLDGTRQEVFSSADTLKKSFVSPPPITRVAQGVNFKNTVFTTEEFMQVFENEKEKNTWQM